MLARNTHPRTTYHGRYVHLRETPHGDLDLVLSAEGQDVFPSIDSIRCRYGNRPALATLLADHLEWGWELVDPQELGAFTLSPILSREIERDSDGAIVVAGRLYWQADLPVVDPIDELRRRGFLEFRGTA